MIEEGNVERDNKESGKHREIIKRTENGATIDSGDRSEDTG
ncbi:MAG: hypothetical protein ABEK59_13395 [Halobacteria archaeon]